ncbi:glycerophosphoryl diester phosphodiesterase membrane domain-containing protein [Erythrobacter dokdonensis]|uniref:Lipoyltransferase n=1 Tax=Erythrobacter dokdonensis DSW-74 TaxID=1300349 RepID=A0A1A7BJ97_9SPHN|nr:glycerophosphoryl diester phosphodiesterase membrane domain-containing protein [Erythrobacter dokdonensis]OBV11270.1 Lipoyltransferase [Erythrobacter dokdonensis DSW-74]
MAKLDMGKAWTQATGLIGANKDTISAIAGLFFFLPSFAAALLVPELATSTSIDPARSGGAVGQQAELQAALDQVTAMYADNWPLFLGITIAGFVGSLSLLALLSDRGNPTVGEALGKGLKSIPSYLAAQLLSALAAGVAIGLPLGLVSAFAPPAVTVVAGLLLIVAMIYLFVKFSLIAPVIAIDGERNPLAAMGRSWRLTKGNSLRILIFLMLLFVTIAIIGGLVAAVLTLILSAFGGSVASIGIGLVNAAVNTIVTVIFLVVIAAIHRQLAGTTPERLSETFE